MRNFFIWLLTPLARYLSGVHPNKLTIIALIAGVLCGFSFWLTTIDTVFYFVGGVLAAISGIIDSLDGIVARMHGQISEFGDFLDHFCDRVVDIAILVGLSFSNHANSNLGLIVTIIILLHNYLGTQIHASFGERFYGAGKAELFVGLVIGSFIFTVLPDIAITIAGETVTLIDIIFINLGIISTGSIFYRFFHVYHKCINKN